MTTRTSGPSAKPQSGLDEVYKSISQGAPKVPAGVDPLAYTQATEDWYGHGENLQEGRGFTQVRIFPMSKPESAAGNHRDHCAGT